MATAAYVPVSHSPMRPPAGSGGRSGVPRLPIDPHAAWRVNSVAGRSAQGPCAPKGEIDTATRSAWSRWRRAASSGRSVKTTSAPVTRSASSAVTDRFDACRYSKRPGFELRIGSPPAPSTFTTSAPASAKSFEQYPPAMPVVRSRTRRSITSPARRTAERCHRRSRGRRSAAPCRRGDRSTRQPTTAVMSHHSSSMATIAGTYGTRKEGCWGLHTTVQL